MRVRADSINHLYLCDNHCWSLSLPCIGCTRSTATIPQLQTTDEKVLTRLFDRSLSMRNINIKFYGACDAFRNRVADNVRGNICVKFIYLYDFIVIFRNGGGDTWHCLNNSAVKFKIYNNTDMSDAMNVDQWRKLLISEKTNVK